MPFLVFFMLAEKRQVWHGTLELFPVSRARKSRKRWKTCAMSCAITRGMSIVTLIVSRQAASISAHRDGVSHSHGHRSGLLNMVPYIGAVMAWLRPLSLPGEVGTLSDNSS